MPAVAVVRVPQSSRSLQPNIVLPGEGHALAAAAGDRYDRPPAPDSSAQPLSPTGSASLALLVAGLGLVNMLSRRRPIVVAA